MHEFMTLLEYIAEKAGSFGSLETSTSVIANDLTTSQQTISRKLIEFENGGLILRKTTPRGMTLQLDEKGRDILEKKFRLLSGVFKKGNDSLSGELTTGLGEGAYYVDQEPYQEQFLSKLGFRAFPGTLNLTMEESQLAKLGGKEKISITGFEAKERTFGALTCYRALLHKQEVAIAVPDRTTHSKEILEVIAPDNLRDTLGLKDGDTIKVKPL